MSQDAKAADLAQAGIEFGGVLIPYEINDVKAFALFEVFSTFLKLSVILGASLNHLEPQSLKVSSISCTNGWPFSPKRFTVHSIARLFGPSP
jgi:hypothetical protein